MSTKGVFLLEIIIALGVVVVAILGLMAAFTAGLKMMNESEKISAATEIGRSFVEQVKTPGYDKTTVGTYDGWIGEPADGTTGFPPAPYPQVKKQDQDYWLEVECAQVSPVVRMLSVDVHWDSQGKVTLKTLIHQ